MGKFFEELAKKLAEKWVSLLVLPGALFVAVAWMGLQLRHRHPLDRSRLVRHASDAAAAASGQRLGTQVLLLVVALLLCTGIGLAVQSLAGVTRSVWLGQWPRFATPVDRALVQARNERWRRRLDDRRRLEQAHPGPTRTTAEQRAIDRAADRITRVAMAAPGRPTWMGDRIHAVDSIALDRYGLDLAYAWPRLWLAMPQGPREEITGAHAAFAAAVATGTWAYPYVLLGLLWWPAVLIGVGVGITGWVRGRAAVAELTTLTESALDLHGRDLAVALGVAGTDTAGPLTVAEGVKITGLVRKGR